MTLSSYIEIVVLIIILAFAVGYWYGKDHEQPPENAEKIDPWDVR